MNLACFRQTLVALLLEPPAIHHLCMMAYLFAYSGHRASYTHVILFLFELAFPGGMCFLLKPVIDHCRRHEPLERPKAGDVAPRQNVWCRR